MYLLRKIGNEFEEFIAATLFTLMVILIVLQILFRSIIDLPLNWTEEMARYFFVWMTYFSASLAVKRNRHLRTSIDKLLPGKIGKGISLLADVIWLAFTIFMVKLGYDLTMKVASTGQVSPTLQWNMGMVYIIIPLGFALISFRILQQIVKRVKGQAEMSNPGDTP